jgi:ABC-type nitrate/sulfonate/bicarbonate transport system substrate-binding protein
MRGLARLFATMVAVLVAASASAWAQAPKHEKLVVAAAPTPLLHWYPFYVALGANYFADEGIDVEIVGLNSGTAMAAAIAGGGADVAPLAMTHAVTSGAQGGGLVATSALFNVYPNSVVLTKDATRKGRHHLGHAARRENQAPRWIDPRNHRTRRRIRYSDSQDAARTRARP